VCPSECAHLEQVGAFLYNWGKRKYVELAPISGRGVHVIENAWVERLGHTAPQTALLRPE
jgi:hypothetical protein